MRGFAKQTRIHGLAALAAFGLIASAAAQAAGVPTATIRRVDVLNRGQNFEMEIQASDPILPQTQVITGPDRLIVDFPHALPGRSLHPLIVSAGAIKGIRMGLFQSNPPITRVVVDLRSPQSYQIFPSGRSVIVKIMQQGGPAAQGGTAAPVVAMGTPPPTAPPPPPAPRVEVSYTNGKLSILANRGTLGEVLRQVQRLTGASVSIPPGADQDQVEADIPPATPREALSRLLNGSSYNVILLGSGSDMAKVTKIILSPRGAGVDVPTNSFPATVAEPTAQAQPEPPPVEDAPEPQQPEPPPPPPPDDQAPPAPPQ